MRGIETGIKMSNDDYIVDPLSNSDVREHARRLRRFLKLADARKREQTRFIARFSDLNSGLSPFTC